MSTFRYASTGNGLGDTVMGVASIEMSTSAHVVSRSGVEVAHSSPHQRGQCRGEKSLEMDSADPHSDALFSLQEALCNV